VTSDTAESSGMQIAILTDGVSPWSMGGIQRHSRMLAIAMAQAGATVSLFHTVRNPADRAAAELLSGFPTDAVGRIRSYIVDYPTPGRLPGHYISDNWRYSRRLLDRYRSEGVTVDFVYAQGLTGLAFAAARRGGASRLPPVGVNQHGYEMFQAAADFKSYLQQLMLQGTFARLARDADCVFAFPGRIRQIVRERCGVPDDRIIEISNAIDGSWIREGRPLPTGKRRFVFVGRHERRKGVPELMHAIRRLPPDAAEFHFVGPIPPRLQLAQPNVIYHGPISDTAMLQDILDGCDVLICPSFAEGMPTVVLEGMARGLAILATDVGATSEWVSSANGVLLPTPAVPAVREALTALLHMESRRLHALQLSSLEKSKRYTWRQVAATTLAVIASKG